MIPLKHYEQFVGKVIAVTNNIRKPDAVFGRLREVDGETLVLDDPTGGTILIDATEVVRCTQDERGERRFQHEVAHKDDPDDDRGEHPMLRLRRMLREQAGDGGAGIIVPPETQAGIDALLADDEP